MIIDFYKTKIDFNTTNFSVGNVVTVTIRLTDFNDNYIVGRNCTAYLIAPNGTRTTLGTGIGGNAQDYNFNFTITDYGIWTVKCNHTKRQFKTNNNFSSQSFGGSATLFYNETQVVLRMQGSMNANNGAWANYGVIPNSPINLRPQVPVFSQDFMRNGVWQISGDGNVYLFRRDGGSGSVEEYMSVTWSRIL